MELRTRLPSLVVVAYVLEVAHVQNASNFPKTVSGEDAVGRTRLSPGESTRRHVVACHGPRPPGEGNSPGDSGHCRAGPPGPSGLSSSHPRRGPPGTRTAPPLPCSGAARPRGIRPESGSYLPDTPGVRRLNHGADRRPAPVTTPAATPLPGLALVFPRSVTSLGARRPGPARVCPGLPPGHSLRRPRAGDFGSSKGEAASYPPRTGRSRFGTVSDRDDW